MMLTDLADVLRAGGLIVVEEDGWERRGHGPMKAVLGVTCHHTANGGAKGDEPSRAVVRDGRPGLDGPLAQLLLRKDGVYRVIAAGRCWHAGDSLTVSQGNSFRIGIEAEAKGVPGTVGDWPEIQMQAYARGCRVLAAHYGFNIDQVLGHKETCSPPRRKSDPDFDMDKFRARVRAVNLKPTNQEDTMTQPINLDSDQWADHKHTSSDVEAWGDPKLAGKSSSWSSLLRFPPAVARVRRELGDALRMIRADISAARSDVSTVKSQSVANGGQLSSLRTEVTELRALVQTLVDRDQPGE